MMGSPLYMSPEQMKSTKDVDARTDIWALGVILYELLTAQLPFKAESIPELSAKILLEEPDPVTNYIPSIDPRLAQIVTRALQKDVSKRYPSVSEFAIDLLPFAPRPARANVERITKLLSQAGMSTSSLAGGSIPPSSPSASRVISGAYSGGARAATSATVAEQRT
jgi:serine/threonine-protein kinase